MNRRSLVNDDAQQPPQSFKSSFLRLVRGLTRSEEEDPYTTASEGEGSPPRGDTGHLTAAVCSPGSCAPGSRTAGTEDLQQPSPAQGPAEPRGWGSVLGGVPHLPGIPTLFQALSPKPSEAQEAGGAADDSYQAAERNSDAQQLQQSRAGCQDYGSDLPSVRQDLGEEAHLDDFNLDRTVTPPVPLHPGNQPLPELSEPSSLMSEAHIRALAAAVPSRYRQARWQLLYSTLRDGISMQTMLRSCRGKAPTVVVVRDMGRHVFGSFCSEAWRLSQRFYGTGETFVFQLEPQQVVWHWWWERNVEEQNDFFMWGTADALAVGGAGGYALWLDKDLAWGLSRNSTTFGNESLASEEEFQVGSVELWWLH